MTFARVRALIVVAVLFITAGVVVIMAIGRDTQTSATEENACSGGLVPAHIKMPDQRSQVTLNIINGTSRPGLAEQVANEFANRGFKIKAISNAPADQQTDDIAAITYGPDAVGAAWLVSAYFLVDEADMHWDIKRKGGEVDVTLGSSFQQLATTTEVNQSIAALGNPDLPPGTCESS